MAVVATNQSVAPARMTLEQCWRDCRQLAQLPVLEVAALVPSRGRVVIVAPHPDDEMLGCAGLLLKLAQRGHDILLIAVTDGEKSHAADSAWRPGMLAQVRPAETAAALRSLGLPNIEILRARLPDSQVRHHRSELNQFLHAHLQDGDTVLTSWHLDGHPDHETVGTACREVARLLRCRILEMPIWAWHWRRPDQAGLPWHYARKLALDNDAVKRKQIALQCYRSQLEPDASTGNAAILPQEVLAHFLRPYEIYFV